MNINELREKVKNGDFDDNELIDLVLYLERENQELKKQLEERDKWLIVCISELMEEYKKDTIWITNQQIESTKNKNISYELYGGNDIKFYQNIKK